MFDLPKKTEINKIIPKKVIYEKFNKELVGSKKTKFDEDISRITIINEISEESTNVKNTSEVPRIFVMKIELKNKNYNNSNILLISKIIKQKLLIALEYEEKFKLVAFESKLIEGDWKKEEEIKLKIEGLNLKSVWENLVKQIGEIELERRNDLKEQIEINEKKEKLKKLIEKTEKKMKREIQSRKKFEIFQELKKYKKELEEM